MTTRTNLIMVDNDFRRRAAITHALAGTPIHVEPFEDLDELVARWPRDGLIMVHDDGQIVGQLIETMTGIGHWLPVVAYSSAPGTNQVVQAVLRSITSSGRSAWVKCGKRSPLRKKAGTPWAASNCVRRWPAAASSA